ncbi:MAG: flagellar assembly peptidoglycan hydrolase FlgJ [Burkholderiales bacterium]|nr:flagellar assembly peptidoglycan hydrolase FlgJ [Burkholderiales bacterium]
MSLPALPQSLAADARGLDELKLRARNNPDTALKDAAKQFEVLFMNMLLKSMRDTVPQDGMFDSEQTRFYTSMLDQQLSEKLSSRGIGLAEIMVRQLQRQAPVTVPADAAAAAEVNGVSGAGAPGAVAPAEGARPAAPVGDAKSFVNRMWPEAAGASRATGIPAHFIIGQAALESGWGAREIRGSDGSASHNLFGVKAGRGWTGRSVEVMTTEYVDGTPRKMVERFRAYDSYAAAFEDYARLLKTNPRYAGVIEGSRDAASFARGLQQAGYATDPNYADKLTRVINGSVLRQSLLG